MSKKNIWAICGLAALLLMLGIFLLLVPSEDRELGHWITFGFIAFSWLMIVCVPYVQNYRETTLSYSLVYIGYIYFVIELLFGVLAMLLTSIAKPGEGGLFKVLIVIQMILAGIFALLFVVALVTNKQTDEAIEKRNSEISYIKLNAAKVLSLTELTAGNSDVERRIRSVYDELHASPVASSGALMQVEQDITDKVNELESLVSGKQFERSIAVCDELTRLIRYRNTTAKSLQR